MTGVDLEARKALADIDATLDQVAQRQESMEDLLEDIKGYLAELVVDSHQSVSLLDLIASDSSGIRDGVDHLGWMAHNPIARLFASIAVAVKSERK